MIEGLDGLLANMDQSGLPELRDLLMAMLGGPTVDGQLLEEQKLLRSRVYRLRFDVDGDVRSLIVKRFLPERARREQLAIQQWLPAVGLPRSAPILLGVAAAQGGQYVWHVYEDLGDWTLDKNGLEPGQAEAMKDCGFLSPLTMSPVIERVEVAVELIAQLHTRFADHALLAACRLHGGDLGLYFFTSSVRDAIRSLQSLRPPKVELSLDRQTLRNRLLQHLRRLIDEQPYRTETMIEFGGPDTLLHGDFSVKNTFVRHTKNKLQAQLIDWDHAGVGPICYDLSNFLVQFPPRDRQPILDFYQQASEWHGQQWPSVEVWNVLFDTVECARLANSIIWPALAAGEDQAAEWAFDELMQIEEWFAALGPVL